MWAHVGNPSAITRNVNVYMMIGMSGSVRQYESGPPISASSMRQPAQCE
jgi:hypothetical protein